MPNDLTTDTPLELLAQQANDHFEAGKHSALEAINHWIEVGRTLTEAKALVPGKWGTWCKKNLLFSKRTAERYVRLYEHREALLPNATPCRILAESPSINTALKLISKAESGNATPKKKAPPPMSGNDIKPESIPSAPTPATDPYQKLIEVMKDANLKLDDLLTKPQTIYLLKKAQELRLQRMPL